MRIAVTGFTGMIGASVAERLEVEHEVIRLGRGERCDVEVNFSLPSAIAAVRLAAIDCLVHCAGVTDEDFVADPASAFVRATLGIDALVRNAIASGARSFVYFSSSHVYGQLSGTVNEALCPNPLSDYSIAHFASEQVLRRHCGAGALRGIVFRPNCVFGIPHVPHSFKRWALIPFSFPREAVTDGRIVLRSSGEQERNFIHLDDQSEYVARTLAMLDELAPFTVINPVGLETMMVREFAGLCAKIASQVTGRDCSVVIPKQAPNTQAQSRGLSFSSLHSIHRSRRGVAEFIEQYSCLLYSRELALSQSS